MAGTWNSERFPQFENALRRLTDEHRELEDEPLHLAISYNSSRETQDIFLFEVIGAPLKNGNDEEDLFEVTFLSSAGFPMAPHEKLHLILTDPQEVRTALREDWPAMSDLLLAIRTGDYKVLHTDELGAHLLALIESEAHRQETVRG